MGLLQVIDAAPGYAKVSLQGPQGSGKTLTSVLIAAQIRKLFGSTKPIAFYDTETGSDYVAGRIEALTGQKPLRVRTRAFSDLMEVVNECANGAADILIVDSITHVWREIQSSYMEKRYNGQKRRMVLPDIMAIKDEWQRWPNAFINSPVHILVCGREGEQWSHQEDEETGKSELVSIGKKMKVETEFGFEASLSIAMSARQEQEKRVKSRDKTTKIEQRKIINTATVIKDRFSLINGKSFDMPTGEEFLPHLMKLNPKAHRPVDTSNKTAASIEVEDGFGGEKRERAIFCEEIMGALTARWPGTTAAEKKAKADAIFAVFNTRSWTKVESLGSETLREGLIRIRALIEKPAGTTTITSEDIDAAMSSASVEGE